MVFARVNSKGAPSASPRARPSTQPTTRSARSTRPRYRTAAGPLLQAVLIAAPALFALREVAFGGRIDLADVRTLWLPTYCFLGRSLASGHLPAWNPYTMSGAPFAADPQSGWMYLPAMALFSALPCDLAIRAMIVVLPCLAGLGLWAFLRSEGLSRPAAVSGGVALSSLVAGSAFATAIPFAGAAAWIALMLAASSRYVRARSWGRRSLWAALTAAAWGQLAGALATDGLAIGSLVLLVFLGAKAATAVRAGRWTPRECAGAVSLLVAALPLVNLAYFLPRLAYLPETGLGLGYTGLQGLSEQITGRPVTALAPGPTAGVAWPLKLATSPGAHLAAVGLALALAAWRARRHRLIFACFAAVGAVSYALSLRVVAAVVPEPLRSLRVVGFYLHSPQRWSLGLSVAVCVLVACGVEAWREAHSTRERLLMAAPGIAVWWLLPPLLGAGGREVGLFLWGAVVGGAVLVASIRRPAMVVLVPALLAAEGALSPLTPEVVRPFQPVADVPSLWGDLPKPIVVAGDYIRAGQLADAIRSGRGRYLTVGTPKVIQVAQRVAGGGFLNEALLFGLSNTDGYNSVQLLRYWTFNRAVEPGRLQYNLAVFGDRSNPAMNLLQVGTLVAAKGRAPPEPGAKAVAVQGSWVVYEREPPPAAASLVASWSVVRSADRAVNIPALRTVTSPGFDPNRTAVLEDDPGIRASVSGGAPGSSPGAVRWFHLGPQAERFAVRSTAPAVLVVRNVFERNWHAALDGRPVRLLRADYIDQGVAVPAGLHTIVLTYDDPWIGWGMLGSGLALVALALVAITFRRRPVPDRRGS